MKTMSADFGFDFYFGGAAVLVAGAVGLFLRRTFSFHDINVVSSLFVLLPAACVAGGSAVLLASKRSELHFDLRQNTYRFREVTLFHSQVHSGSWQDFQGVFVRTTQLEFGEACHVGLAWQKERASTLYLGFYDDPVKAEMFAMEVAEKLSLPIVPAPELGKSPVLLG